MLYFFIDDIMTTLEVQFIIIVISSIIFSLDKKKNYIKLINDFWNVIVVII